VNEYVKIGKKKDKELRGYSKMPNICTTGIPRKKTKKTEK
jgi:hypothetical protein